MATLKVDYENNAEAWWNAAQAVVKSGRNPTFTRIMNALARSDEVGDNILRGELDSFIDTARKLDGWDSGNRHARNPLLWDYGADCDGETTGGSHGRMDRGT